MMRTMRIAAAVVAGVCGVAIGSARAQLVTAVWPVPALDRWNYPFNSNPLMRPEASVFGAIGLAGFDDRDGQFLVGFDTAAVVPAGHGVGRYRVISGRLVTRTSQGNTFVYDPTFDALADYLPSGDPPVVHDPDLGRPVELYPVGYRNGQSAATYEQGSPFGGAPLVQPAEGARNAFAAVFDAGGQAIDASRNVRLNFEVRPMAVGRTTVATAGGLVPQDADFVFEMDTGYHAAMEYVAQGLDAGRVNLMVSSLHEVEQGVATSPLFYTRANPLGVPARLELTVCVGPRADWDCDGTVAPADIAAFVNLWFTDLTAGTARADLNGDGVVTPSDVAMFVSLWFASL